MAESMEETALVDVQPALPPSDKRPIEIHDDNQPAEPQSRKKPRNGCDLGPNLRRVAEIVLVMSTMTALRGGKKPSDAEVGLMAEARAKLVRICEGLAPKDIVGREGISSLIEDLGLHGRDQKLGFRGPRLTIAEKLAQSKKKVFCAFSQASWDCGLSCVNLLLGSSILSTFMFSCPILFDLLYCVILRELLCLTVRYVQTSLNETCMMRLDRCSSLYLVTDNLEIFNPSGEREKMMYFSNLLTSFLAHYSRRDTLVFLFLSLEDPHNFSFRTKRFHRRLGQMIT